MKRSVERRSPIVKSLVHKLPIPDAASFKVNELSAAAAAALPEDVKYCPGNITYACWRYLYQIPDASTIPASAGNSLGLFEQGDYFAKKDMDSYYKQFAPFIPKHTYPVGASIDGGDYDQPYTDTALVTGEANLDINIA